jgi:hypothetical protein
MVRPFESYMEEDQVQRVLELSVKCTDNETLDVTDLDLVPVGHETVPVTRRLQQRCAAARAPARRRAWAVGSIRSPLLPMGLPQTRPSIAALLLAGPVTGAARRRGGGAPAARAAAARARPTGLPPPAAAPCPPPPGGSPRRTSRRAM